MNDECGYLSPKIYWWTNKKPWSLPQICIRFTSKTRELESTCYSRKMCLRGCAKSWIFGRKSRKIPWNDEGSRREDCIFFWGPLEQIQEAWTNRRGMCRKSWRMQFFLDFLRMKSPRIRVWLKKTCGLSRTQDWWPKKKMGFSFKQKDFAVKISGMWLAQQLGTFILRKCWCSPTTRRDV